MGSEVLIVPEETYTAYIQTPDIMSAAKLQEELQEDNRVKLVTGDRHLVLLGRYLSTIPAGKTWSRQWNIPLKA